MHPQHDREALTVAMALVPTMYARNRLFSLHREPEVRRAKARAAMIRGVVQQLAGAHGEVTGLSVVRHGEVVVVRYRVPSVRFERRVELTEIEHALLAYLSARAGVRGFAETHEDRAHLDAALMRLGGDISPTLVAELRSRPSDVPPAR
jgi:hypothetical protein